LASNFSINFLTGWANITGFGRIFGTGWFLLLSGIFWNHLVL
jgi:hypothetical protein